MLKSSLKRTQEEPQQHLKSESSHSPLHQATIAGDDAAVEILLIGGADRYAKDNKVTQHSL